MAYIPTEKWSRKITTNLVKGTFKHQLNIPNSIKELLCQKDFVGDTGNRIEVCLIKNTDTEDRFVILTNAEFFNTLMKMLNNN